MIDPSLYRPTAYFVDMLTWLKKQQANDSCLAFDILIKRRPDLIKIKLNKHNEQTLFPHIDLAIEVLEEKIKPDPNRIYEGCPRLNENVYKMLFEYGYKHYKCEQQHSIVDCDDCRIMRQNSLTSYLIDSGLFASKDEITNELLIEVDIVPRIINPIITSRIHGAISTTQFFIQRCVLGIEAVGLEFTEDKNKGLNHLMTYRRWAAYRGATNPLPTTPPTSHK